MRREPRYDVPKKAPGSLRLVQEFLNTGDKEHGREWLDTPEALRHWLDDRGLPVPARPTLGDLARAHETREALRELVHANSGRPASTRAVRTLDALADESRLTIRFHVTGVALLAVGATGVVGGLGHVLARTVEAANDGRWSRLKACPNCSWAFYDYSPNRSAKWCSMLLCGNRLKTRAYYRRTHGGRPTVAGAQDAADRRR